MTIFDEKGRELSTTAGPYEEGVSMILKCIVIGGKYDQNCTQNLLEWK